MKIDFKNIKTTEIMMLMMLAYIFSFSIRMIWVVQFQDNINFFWNEQLMINTNDGYFFASGVQKELMGMHQDNPLVSDVWSYGIIAVSTFFATFTSLSLETIILYMPAIISSLVVIPIILIAQLYKQILWGFLAALLGSIAWSYYNRTMIGYYDTDMFSAMAPMFILYFLMKSTLEFNLKSALYASIAIVVYPFLYDQGQSLIYAMGIIYVAYMIFYHKDEDTTYKSLILIFFALLSIPVAVPYVYILKILTLITLYFGLKYFKIKYKILIIIALIAGVLFFFLSNVLGLILGKISTYTTTGTVEQGLHFYSVVQTVREAGQIPFSTFANRISGSQMGVLIALLGYIILIIRHRPFVLSIPLVGIGLFALVGGLRFTVYAVPIAAMSAIYLFFVLAEFLQNNKLKYMFVSFATIAMLYPNIQHILEYKVPTVLNKHEVRDLVTLNELSDSKDYTLAWWDYGYPIWYYSETSTLIDGGKHHNDNFIISKIMQTSSPQLAVNLSKLAVETYVESNYNVVANTIFKNAKENQVDPNILLSELTSSEYVMPKKTRDVFLYLPYRMLNIFPTVAVFGNLDLTTGEAIRKISFYPTVVMENKKGIITLQNGIVFDTLKGEIILGKSKKDVKYFIVAQNMKDGQTNLQSQLYHTSGEYAIVYLKSYGRFVVMDTETFKSTYVQMFMLGKYDKNLFELVISSVYSKIYKIKDN